jgi:hypothetical protein
MFAKKTRIYGIPLQDVEAPGFTMVDWRWRKAEHWLLTTRH